MNIPLTEKQLTDLARITDETVQGWAYFKLLIDRRGFDESTDVLRFLVKAAVDDSNVSHARHAAVSKAARERMEERKAKSEREV